jgi:hypothetical protein
VDGKSREALNAELSNRGLPLCDADRAKLDKLRRIRQSRRFTLVEVFALVTVACLFLALSHYLPIQIFAGSLGFTILVTLYFVPRASELTRIAWPAWWTMAAIYIGAAIAAVVS